VSLSQPFCSGSDDLLFLLKVLAADALRRKASVRIKTPHRIFLIILADV
jgi:hypothetical protein